MSDTYVLRDAMGEYGDMGQHGSWSETDTVVVERNLAKDGQITKVTRTMTGTDDLIDAFNYHSTDVMTYDNNRGDVQYKNKGQYNWGITLKYRF